MPKKTSELLFALISNAVFSKEIQTEIFPEIKSSLSDIYALAKHHDLSHLLFAPLCACGLISQGEEIYTQLEREKLSALFRSIKMESELSAMKKVLSEGQIVHIPLKGSVIRSLYPEAYMRTSCDIDLLIKEEDIDTAIELLQKKLNYTTDGKRNFHDISLFSPSGVHLELHFSILDDVESHDKVLRRAFDYAFPTSEGAYTYSLTPEFLLFHLISHAAHHFVLGGAGIKPFIDLYVLNNHIKYDRTSLISLCKEGGVEKFLVNSEMLSKVWFVGDKHTEITSDMEGYVLNGGVYGTDKTAALATQARKGGKIKSIFQLIFMPYEKLKTLYPSLEGRKLLLPFYQVRRWFRVLLKGRFGRAVTTIKANATVSKETRENTSRMFEELGLQNS